MTHNTSQSLDRLRRIAREAMRDRGLDPDFSPAVLAEVAAVRGAPSAEAGDVRDLRSLLWASIDNDDSRDLDQLSVSEPAAGGAVKVLVAVADVAETVRPGSAVDGHAQTNTTSVYTAAEIFPMLPERLSTDLTSLNDHQDRLAIVVEMTVGKDGVVGASGVYRALVRNKAKLAYNSVAAWLDGKGPMPAPIAAVSGLDQNLRAQDRVADSMRKVRHQHGALTLDTAEARAVFQGDALADLLPDEPNNAKALIEDFMIGANGVIARFLDAKGVASLRRVLRTPERWDGIVRLAAEHGTHLPGQPDGAALNAFLTNQRQSDPKGFPAISLAVVKMLGRGEYALERPGARPVGHFGLAVRDYTHSTAPNRRYPDLITQRLVKAVLAGKPAPYDEKELAGLAAHCTEQEDAASKVERQVRKSAAALLLESRIGERFDAIVTGASQKGTWARIWHPSAEGKVVRGFAGLDVGDRVRVELVSTDVERGFIDFARSH